MPRAHEQRHMRGEQSHRPAPQYDNEGRLTAWQNAPSSPTSTAQYLYDGEGNRVEQQVTINGSMTTTTYVADGLEEIASSGASTALIKYFSNVGSLLTARQVR